MFCKVRVEVDRAVVLNAVTVEVDRAVVLNAWLEEDRAVVLNAVRLEEDRAVVLNAVRVEVDRAVVLNAWLEEDRAVVLNAWLVSRSICQLTLGLSTVSDSGSQYGFCLGKLWEHLTHLRFYFRRFPTVPFNWDFQNYIFVQELVKRYKKYWWYQIHEMVTLPTWRGFSYFCKGETNNPLNSQRVQY